ncbi:hypothetical protein UlMin_027558 [Ulmus minor]
MGGFPSQQRKYDPYAPTFNPRWKDHPNLSYSGNHYVAPNNPTGFNNLRRQQNYQPRQPTPPQNQGKSLEDLITMLTNSIIQFQNDTKSHLKSLENQFSQLATTVGRLEAQGSGKLSSQIVINPKENASAISLRSGKQLDEAYKKPIKASDEKDLSLERDDATTPKEDNPPRKVSHHSSIPINVPYLPFPSRFSTTKKDRHEKEIFETFQKVQVNIPLLDAIKQVPWYAKFLKELCTNKRKLKGNEIVNFGEKVLVVLQRKIPPKYDFYVIDMCEDANSKAAPLLLGRPFMKTTWTKIDVHNRTLTMEFDGESISFNIFKAMGYPSNIHSCFTIDIIDTLVQEVCEFGRNDTLELLLTRNLEAEDLKKQMRCPIK